MSQVIDAVDTGLGGEIERKVQSKIKDYKLEDDVIKMKIEGYNSSKIATKCNEILKARTDNCTYIKIHPQNVITFLKTKTNELAKSDPAALTGLIDTLPDVSEKINALVSMLEDEIGKIRNTETPVLDSKAELFTKLIDRLMEAIKMTANIRGMIQPTVAIAIFNNISSNVEKLASKVKESKTLEPNAKNEILDLIDSELLNENLLKTVQGQVVEVKEKKE